MIKLNLVFWLLILVSCTGNTKKVDEQSATTPPVDSTQVNIDTTKPVVVNPRAAAEPAHSSNDRFRNVKVTKQDENEYLVTGKARVFEAAFNWVIEDGHQEIDSGYSTTDAGAPEWGNFRFTLKLKKQKPNTVRHIILYEASAKDGSRQSELPILLP